MSWEGVECPACGSRKIDKKLSRFAVVGTGESAPDFGGDHDAHEDSGPECSGDPGSCHRCDMD